MKVKVLGLQRSGTNYLRWLLEHDFKLADHRPGLEHAFPWMRWSDYFTESSETVEELTAGCTRVVIYKDVGHWLGSYERSPRIAQKQLAERFGDPNPTEHYYLWHGSWAGKAHFIRYESFLSNFGATLAYLGTLLGMKPQAYEQPRLVPASKHWRPEDARRYV